MLCVVFKNNIYREQTNSFSSAISLALKVSAAVLLLSAVQDILVQATELNLTYFADFVLAEAVLRDHLVEVIVDLVVVVHELVAARLQVCDYLALLDQALRNLLFVLALFLDQLLILNSNTLNLRFKFDFLLQFMLQRLLEPLNLLDVLHKLRHF